MRYKLINGLSVSIVLVDGKQIVLSPLEVMEVEGDVKVVSGEVKIQTIGETEKEEEKKKR